MEDIKKYSEDSLFLLEDLKVSFQSGRRKMSTEPTAWQPPVPPAPFTAYMSDRFGKPTKGNQVIIKE